PLVVASLHACRTEIACLSPRRPVPQIAAPAIPQEPLLEYRILGALAFGELRQGFSSDQLLEMRGLLMGGERRFVLEDLIEEELRGLGARTVDHEALHSRLFPRPRRK